MKVPTLADIQKAALMVETLGVHAYDKVVRKFGIRLAQILIVAHLRVKFGALNPGGPKPNLNGLVDVELAKHRLYGKFNLHSKNKGKRLHLDGRVMPGPVRHRKQPEPMAAACI